MPLLGAAPGLGRVPPPPENSAPSATLTLFPSPFLVPAPDHFIMVAADGITADVVLDGTLSTDPDGDVVTHAWMHESSATSLGFEPTTVSALDVGLHEVSLVTSDGEVTANLVVLIEVIGPLEAADILGATLASANMARKDLVPLRHALQRFRNAMLQGQAVGALGRLEAFRNKLNARAQVLDRQAIQQLMTSSKALSDILALALAAEAD